MSELNVDGMALAPGVAETIISIAASEVEGVASVGSAGSANRSLRTVFGQKPSTQGIDVATDESGALQVSVRIEVQYGYALPDLAANVRQAIADAVAGQIGVPLASVDVYIDGIQFGR